MASTYQLKSRFQSLLRPLAAWAYRCGITANQVTVGSCLISVALGVVAVFDADRALWFWMIALWFLLRMMANALDGMLAREYGQASQLGAVLNELGDIISDIALYLPFAFISGTQPWLVIAIILLAVISEFAGVLGAALGGERGYQGPMGKSDRALVFGVVGVIVGCGIAVATWINIVWIIVAALLVVTVFNRSRSAVRGRTGRSES